MVSQASIVPRSALLSLAVTSLVVWPLAPAAAAFLSVFNTAGAGAESNIEPIAPPDFQSTSQFGATGPVISSVTADRGAASRFAVGHGFSTGTLDFGYFAGTADSQAMVPRGMLDTDGTGREFEYFASSYADVTAESQASFLVMPASPWLIGTMGTVVVPIVVQGTLSATLSPDPIIPGGRLRADSAAQVQWSLNVGTHSGTTFGMLFGTVDTLGAGFGDMPSPPGQVPTPHMLTFDVVLGMPTIIDLGYQLRTSAGIGSAIGVGGRGEGLANLGSTFRWMGISQVLDADGNPIQYSIDSDAGFDWTQAAPTPVPVPPVLLPLLTAVWASGALFARRRSRMSEGS